MKAKRSVMLICFFLLSAIFLMVSACEKSSDGNQSSQTSSTDSQVAADGPVTVSFYASPPGNVIDLKTNWFTKYVEEQFKIKINWMITPSSDRAAKQPLLLASGDYPEVFWNGDFKPSDILKYSKQGILVPLNPYIDEYAPNVKTALETVPGLKDIAMAPDGNIYGLPAYNWCDHCFWSGKMWINVELLNQFGLQMPTTTDEFERVLQVFKDNGIVPLTGSTDGWNSNPLLFLMNAFTYNNGGNYFHVDSGNVIFSPATNEWRQGLEYINRLYSKGLLDKQAFSQQNEVVKRLVSEKKVGVVPQGCSCGFVTNGSANPDFVNWRTVPPLKGPSGTQYAAFYGNGNGSLTFTVTNKATEEQKIALAKLLNFIYTPEGMEMLDFGPEGKFWTRPKPGEKDEDGNDAILNTAWNKFYAAGSRQNEGWDQMGPIFQSKQWRRGQVAYPITHPDGLASMLRLETEKNYAGKQPAEVYPAAVWISEQDTQQFAMYQTNINKFVQQWSSEFIVGTKSLNNDWDAYIKGLEGLGLKPYLEMSQKAMQKPFDTGEFQQTPGVVQYLESLK